MTAYRQHPYPQALGFGEEYERVRQFFLRIHAAHDTAPFFPWAAWEWMFCLPNLTLEKLAEIVVWERNEEIVGLSTIESAPGSLYFDVDPACTDLKPIMLTAALAHHSGVEPLRVCISDADLAFQQAARRIGFVPSQEVEHAARLDLTTPLAYTLPAGFTLRDHAAGLDLHKFNRCLWRGFNRAGEVDYGPERMEMRRRQLAGPHQDPALSVVVVAPNGDYASYCGIWHEPGTHYAYVEPVCTDPDYRGLGLGKAAVLEACRRCAERGATVAVVASGQEFYYRIGFNPMPGERWWAHATPGNSQA